MKKELAMMSAMVAMAAGMTSCCCKPCNQGRPVTMPVRVEPTKGATVKTAPVKKTTVRTQPAVRTQPTVRKQPVVRTQTVVKQVPVYVQPAAPTLPVNPHAVIELQKNFNNAGVPYNAENMGGWYGCGYSNGYVPVCPPCHRGVYHR